MNKLYIFIFVNLPMFIYLCESFFDGKDDLERYTLTFSTFLLICYSFQFSLALSFTNALKIKGNLAYVHLIFISLSVLGSVFTQMPIVPLIILLQYATFFLLLQKFLSQSLLQLKNTLFFALVFSIFGFCFFAVLHSVASNGDYLFTLGQIQLPFVFFTYMTIRKTLMLTKKQMLNLNLCIILYIILLYLGSQKALQLNQYRLQFLPIGLTFLIALLFLPRPIKFFLSLPILYIANSNYDIISAKMAYRLGSFDERVSIIKSMASESFNFFIARGFGASLKQYDISKLTSYSKAERALYPPHSGLAVILHEFSILITLVILVLTLRYITKSIQAQRVHSSNNIMFWSVKKYAVPLLFILVFTWLIENIFYLKAVITGATFSDDFLFVILLLVVFLMKLKFNWSKI